MIVFVDLDGVLADLNAGFARYHNIELTPQELTQSLKETYQQRWPDETYASKDFWQMYGESFWAELPMMPDWAKTMRYAQMKATDGLFIATACPSDEARAGKTRWVRHNLGLPKEQVICIHDKWLLAGPDRLLIDDNLAQCQKFREAGGQVAFIEQPWSHLTF